MDVIEAKKALEIDRQTNVGEIDLPNPIDVTEAESGRTGESAKTRRIYTPS
jgi:hypothetical protein